MKKEFKNEQGQLHNTNGPAVETASGGYEYWLNGDCHREAGPAIKRGTTYMWFFRGTKLLQISTKSQETLDKAQKLFESMLADINNI